MENEIKTNDTQPEIAKSLAAAVANRRDGDEEKGFLVQSPTVLIKLLRGGASIPQRGTPHSACYDVSTDLEGMLKRTLQPGEVFMAPTGFATEIPPGYWIKFHQRSGISSKLLVMLGGVVDSDYRNEWKVVLWNAGNRPYIINRGDRIAQLTVEEVRDISWNQVPADYEFSETSRTGGFGSTGN